MSSNRRFYKCGFCRDRKGKCLPVDRRWGHHTKDRCTYCVARNLPCGPNINTTGQEEMRTKPNQSVFNAHALQFGNVSQSSASTRGYEHGSNRAHAAPSPAFTSWRPPISPRGPQSPTLFPQSFPSSSRPISGGAITGAPVLSYAQAAKRPASLLPTIHKWLAEVDAQIELHLCLCCVEHSLNSYRRAEQRQPSLAPDDKENVIQNLLGMLQGMISDRSTNILHAIKCHDGSERMSLLEQLLEKLEHFLSDLRLRDSGQDGARSNSWRPRTNSSPRINIASQSGGASLPSQQNLDVNSTQTSMPLRLRDLLSDIADAMVPEYIATGSHVRAYRVRRLSSATARLRPPDEDRIIHFSELESFLASFDQVNRALSTILQLQQRYAQCFNNGQNNHLSPGHVAMLSNNRSIAHALYECGRWNHHDLDFLNRGAVHWAAELGDLRLLHLIDQKDPQAIRQSRTDVYGLSPLSLAAIHGHLDVYKFLTERGADPGSRNVSMKNALFFSASMGHLSVVEYQLKTCFSAQDSRGFCSPLHASAAGGHTEVALHLFEAGASMLFQGQHAITVAERHRQRHLVARLRQAENERYKQDLRITQSTQDRLSNASAEPGRRRADNNSGISSPPHPSSARHVDPANLTEASGSTQEHISDSQEDSSFELDNLSSFGPFGNGSVDDFLDTNFDTGSPNEVGEMYNSN